MDYHPDKIYAKAISKKPDFKLIADKVKNMNSKQADQLINGLHEKAFEKIKCLECANCCKSLGPRLIRSDIERISSQLKMGASEFINNYLVVDEDNDYVFKTMPCPFLLPDNYCQIYNVRPRACREYPHTDQKNIRSILSLTIKNTETCPAVFDIFTHLASF